MQAKPSCYVRAPRRSSTRSSSMNRCLLRFVNVFFCTLEWIRNGYERCSCCCWVSCCYQIFKVLKLFHFAAERNQTLHTDW